VRRQRLSHGLPVGPLAVAAGLERQGQDVIQAARLAART